MLRYLMLNLILSLMPLWSDLADTSFRSLEKCHDISAAGIQNSQVGSLQGVDALYNLLED